jgi:S1-C subfamily serine protease
VTLVVSDSPAEKAGMKVGDVVKSFGGTPVKTFSDLVDLIGKRKIGDKVEIEFTRDDKPMKVEITVARRPR